MRAARKQTTTDKTDEEMYGTMSGMMKKQERESEKKGGWRVAASLLGRMTIL